MAFVLFSLQSQRTRYNRQDYRSAGTKFDLWLSKYSVETTLKKDFEKPLTHLFEISSFFDSLPSPHDSFVALPVVFLAVVVLFGNFAMMSLPFLFFSVYFSSKAFKSCERQSLDHSESTASLLELVQVCLWCLKEQNILFRLKGKSDTKLTVREQLRRAEKWNINLSVIANFLSCCSVRDRIQIQKAPPKKALATCVQLIH